MSHRQEVWINGEGDERWDGENPVIYDITGPLNVLWQYVGRAPRRDEMAATRSRKGIPFMKKRLLTVAMLTAMFAAVLVPAQLVSADHEPICAAVLLAEGDTVTIDGVTYEIVQNDDGGSGNQAIIGTEGNDNLSGGSGNDILCGLGGDDVLDGGSGNDFVIGDIGLINGAQPGPGANPANAGNDTLSGGSGTDELYGDNGNDSLDAGSGADFLAAGGGTDDCDGGSGNNTGNGSCETGDDL